MAKIPTIKIQADNDLGYLIINQSDFSPSTMTEFGKAKKASPKKVVEKKESQPVEVKPKKATE